MHEDFAQRAVVRTATMPWTPRDGIEEKLLEAARDRRTSLVRLPAGATLPIASRGSLDVLILDGQLASHGAWTYLREPAGLRALSTARGCTLFVKQRPAQRPTRCALDVRGVVFESGLVPGLALGPVHTDLDGTVTLLRFDRGTHVPPHHHRDGEELFVLDGELRDEFGTYGVHDWVRQPPASVHSVDAPNGCLTFSLAHHLGSAIFRR